MSCSPLFSLALHTFLAASLGNGLDSDRFAVRSRAQAELYRLPLSAFVGVQLVAQRSPECSYQAERWLTAKQFAPTPDDYGVVCYGSWNEALLLFVLRHDRYAELLRANGILQSRELFLFEINPIRPWEHIHGLTSIRARIGTSSPGYGDSCTGITGR